MDFQLNYKITALLRVGNRDTEKWNTCSKADGNEMTMSKINPGPRFCRQRMLYPLCTNILPKSSLWKHSLF